ncbi:GlxA family transcriptional regulator [Azospirillum oryzae]|nr:GlxA family transcriptional regulator [Azospirillum oryzae]
MEATAMAETRHVGFLLLPKFSMLAFTSAVEPLRVANRLADRPLYRWTMIAPAATVSASNGMRLLVDHGLDRPLPDVEVPDLLIVCAGFDPAEARGLPVTALLRRAERRGAILGAIDTGSFILGWAGLLDGYEATVHWECLDSFREQFPQVSVQPCLFEIDRRRMTCAGGTAALDMMLHMIRLDAGYRLATAVSEQFIHAGIRDSHTDQRLSIPSRYGIAHPKLARVIRLMEEHLEEPLSLDGLALRAGLSLRQLERLFQGGFGQSPQRYYVALRLQRARSLVRYSTQPLAEIAVACGFQSYEHFSRSYRRSAGLSPQQDRLTAYRATDGPTISR